MGYAENRGSYWRGRFKIAPGEYGTVKDDSGRTIKFASRREAERAANDRETDVRRGAWADPDAGKTTFGEYAASWYAEQELAPSTMQNYRRHIEEHLLPTFENVQLADLTRKDVLAWERSERAADYAVSSIKTWHATLHLILSDAVDEGLIGANPATRRRGRGRRAGRSRNRTPEKAITDALGALLVAERASLLSGRDDEFVACTNITYTGMRWGESVGLEPEFVRRDHIRVEWQLYELDSGEFERCPPKDDSYRNIDVANWHYELLVGQTARSGTRTCACHGRRYVYRGQGTPGFHGAVKMVDVARRVGVSTATISHYFNRPNVLSDGTRDRVKQAIADLGYRRGPAEKAPADHWRRTGFATWLFQPAATGWYPKKAPQDARPVPVLAEPWPGIPLRGRNGAGRADACWLPIAPGLTPHGLRHTHRALMEQIGTPKVLMDERMGHLDSSVSARYSHVTPEMRAALLAGLTELWRGALRARKSLCPRSAVAVLDALLQGLP